MNGAASRNFPDSDQQRVRSNSGHRGLEQGACQRPDALGRSLNVIRRLSLTSAVITLGHEMAGVLADGREVAIEPLVLCGECDLCAIDSYNLCRAVNGQADGLQKSGHMVYK